jgi:hypothetical protein
MLGDLAWLGLVARACWASSVLVALAGETIRIKLM